MSEVQAVLDLIKADEQLRKQVVAAAVSGLRRLIPAAGLQFPIPRRLRTTKGCPRGEEEEAQFDVPTVAVCRSTASSTRSCLCYCRSCLRVCICYTLLLLARARVLRSGEHLLRQVMCGAPFRVQVRLGFNDT